MPLQVLDLHLALDWIANVRLQHATLHIEEDADKELLLAQILAKHVLADACWDLSDRDSDLFSLIMVTRLSLILEPC